MEQKKAGFFSKVFYSISNMSFYETVIKESVGKAFKYLVLFSLILGAISSIKPVISFLSTIDLLDDFLTKDVPDFTFTKGELTIEGKMPMVIDAGDRAAIIIDTSGKSDESVLDKYNQGTFISNTYMINKKNAAQTERIDFSQLGSFTFTKSSLTIFLSRLKPFTALFPIVIIIAMLTVKLIDSMFISVLAAIVGSIIKINLSYVQTYSIGIYAMTLPSIIEFLVGLLPFNIPFFFVLYYAIVIIYLYNAFSHIKKEMEMQAKNDAQLI